MRFNIKTKALVAVASIASVGALFLMQMTSAASTGQMYVSPASGSVQQGSNITIAMRIDPQTDVSSVQATLTFDTTKLQYVSTDASASPFTTQLQQTQSGSTLTVIRGDLTGTVNSDSLIANVTFKALAGSGSTSLTLSNANAGTPGGSYTDPVLVNGIVSFTTPSSGGGGTGGGTGGGSTGGGTTGGGSSSTGGTSSGGSHSSSGSSSGTSGSSGGSSSAPTTKPATTLTPGDVQAQFTLADLGVTTNNPTQAYINLGLTQDLGTNTPLTTLGTSHTITIDSSLLIPGTTYYYQVIAKDEAGNVTKSAIEHFTTKGYTLHVAVLDKTSKPFKNATLTLHSTAYTAKTDSKGVVVFNNVAPGEHTVTYTSGKKTYTQHITVENAVVTDATTGKQSAAVQNLSIQLAATQSSLPLPLIIIVVVVLLVLAAGFLLFRNKFKGGGPLGLNHQPVVAGAAVITGGDGASPTPTIVNTPLSSLSDRLESMPNAPLPGQGQVITPNDPNTTSSQPRPTV